MKNKTIMKKRLLSYVLVAALAGTAATLHSQVINYTDGRADLTFFYDRPGNSWDTVFRAEGDAAATGLTTQADQDRVGAGAGDHNFDTLNVLLARPGQATVNSRQYFVSNISGAGPDLGIRARLRDESGDQFETFTLRLDWNNSVRPAGAEFAMFNFDGFGNPIIVYDTAEDNFSEIWDVWGHSHWHWGFSEVGDYSLAFEFEGESDGFLSSLGTTNVAFQVIPEPGTVALLLGLGALGFVILRQRGKV